MFHRILVPVDETERSHQSLLLAKHLAKQFDATVLLVRVKPFMETQKDIAVDLRALDALAAEVRRDGVACDSIFDLDRTVEGIVETAKYQDNDLIVMAPHHRSWLESVRHPSVTEDMIAQSPAPLLIWPERMAPEAATSFLESPASAIIVPLDGSELAEQALPYAAELATRYGRGLILVRVVPPTVSPSMGSQMAQLELHIRAEEQTAARTYLRHVRERMNAQFELAVQSMILTGSPATELAQLAEAHPDDILVMTTHGRGRVSRAFLGSVAAQLTHHAAVPLFILPPNMPHRKPDAYEKATLAAHN